MTDHARATSVEHGIECTAADEKRLVKNVNAFLASLEFRKLYKTAPRYIQPPERTFRFAHYYNQFLKQHPRWYFDLKPNADLDGKHRFPDHPDCGWTLFTHNPYPEVCSKEDQATLDRFFAQLVAGLGFPARVVHEYRRGEDRL